MTAPQRQTTSLEEAIQHIAAERSVWVRVGAVRQDDGTWRGRLLELTSGEAPPSWEQRDWEYGKALFGATLATGPAVREWLQGGKMALRDREILIPELVTSVNWERRQSRSAALYESLDWPATEASLSLGSSSQAEPHGHLVPVGDAPSFVSFYAAAVYFFSLNTQPLRGSLPERSMYRHQDRRARINRVRIAADSVEVEVEGDAMGGMMVELAGDVPGRHNASRTATAPGLRSSGSR